MNMLVTIDIIRDTTEGRLKCIELSMYPALDHSPREGAGVAGSNQQRQMHMKRRAVHGIRKIEVQAEVYWQTGKLFGYGCFEMALGHATNRAQPSHSREIKDAGVNAGVHAEVVGANDEVFGGCHGIILPEIGKSSMKKVAREIVWFIIVGCAAAMTHWLVVVGCVRTVSMAPPIAHVVGWLVAFLVSFSGHYRLTFKSQQKSLPIALRRFFFVSASGFAVNELAYSYLLHVTSIRYDLLLAIILVAIAVLTFIVSRWWAFRHKPAAT